MGDKPHSVLTITITGPPIAKKRPRFARRGKFVQTYNPQETEEGRWLWEAKQHFPHGFEPHTGPIIVSMAFFMPVPKSISKKQRKAMLDAFFPHTKKPDLDNLVKFAKDALNGTAWADDSQVYDLRAYKCYDELPRTEITLEKH